MHQGPALACARRAAEQVSGGARCEAKRVLGVSLEVGVALVLAAVLRLRLARLLDLVLAQPRRHDITWTGLGLHAYALHPLPPARCQVRRQRLHLFRRTLTVRDVGLEHDPGAGERRPIVREVAPPGGDSPQVDVPPRIRLGLEHGHHQVVAGAGSGNVQEPLRLRLAIEFLRRPGLFEAGGGEAVVLAADLEF